MARKSARSSRLAIPALCVGLALALLAVPASAGLDGGRFFVHAYDSGDPQITATVGMADTDAGSPDPGDEEDAVLASYSCGPMKLNITQSMVDFSKANEALIQEGRSSELKTHADGWQVLYTSNSSPAETKRGFPEDGTKPGFVFAAGPDLTPQSTKAGAVDTATQCTVLDTRADPQAGHRFSYSWSPSDDPARDDFYDEGRYVLQEGELVAVLVTNEDNGFRSIIRTEIGSTREAKSDRFPSFLMIWPPDGIKDAPVALPAESINVVLPTAVDGYNRIEIKRAADGSGSTTYFSGESSTDRDFARRKDGPVEVFWNSEGQLASLSYFDSEGVRRWLNTRPTPYTVAEYNEISGQEWNGEFHQFDDFDLSFPFEPTPPE